MSPTPRGTAARTPAPPRPSSRAGFSLLELVVVLAVLGIIVAIALPAYRDATQRAREAVLQEDLYRMRDAIDEYYTDQGHYPPSLQDLAVEGYVRAVPEDPITGSADTWIVEYAPWEMTEPDQAAGIWNVRSGARGNGLDGTPYRSW